jgi:hypothetical protein
LPSRDFIATSTDILSPPAKKNTPRSLPSLKCVSVPETEFWDSGFETQFAIPCRSSGQHGFAVRVLPHHPDLADPFEPGLVGWG